MMYSFEETQLRSSLTQPQQMEVKGMVGEMRVMDRWYWPKLGGLWRGLRSRRKDYGKAEAGV